MSLAVVGVNHRTAPLEVRERFAHAAREVPASLERVLAAGAGGGVLLSTCNRTEFYLAEPGEGAPDAVWAILSERLGFQSAVDEIEDGLMFFTATGHLLFANRAAEPVIGKPLGDVDGKPLGDADGRLSGRDGEQAEERDDREGRTDACAQGGRGKAEQTAEGFFAWDDL